MTADLAPPGMGLTARMRATLDAITAYVARHGVMPSRRTLAAAMETSLNNSTRLTMSLIERGELNTATPGGVLTGFGSEGVAVFIPAHLASQLAAFCANNSERVTAVVADAVALHLDQMGGGVE